MRGGSTQKAPSDSLCFLEKQKAKSPAGNEVVEEGRSVEERRGPSNGPGDWETTWTEKCRRNGN